MQVAGLVVPTPGVAASVEWLEIQAAVTRGAASVPPPFATATTDAQGRFRMVVDDATPWNAVSFSVRHAGTDIPVRNLGSTRQRTGIGITLQLLPPQDGRIAIADLAGLHAQEAEVVARLNRLPQGGLAFFTDPVRALGAAGVDLAPQAVAEFRIEFPHTPTSTALAFAAVLATPAQGSNGVRVRLSGLFQQGGGKP
ncbi:hypothetical protein SAMN05192583_3257 [Sphingomonas gellani]|uniref:Uncharacterized protein n=1 Tax=Sphingomonas gellani TaxID=1166340 RepID=A0A1H8IAN7_9SPHN|nr:hypothetical protein [Sphingomonas gellani]SEN65106.1 hypothetical protein SAMN05192583_3257 [Sphingomonas gellani]